MDPASHLEHLRATLATYVARLEAADLDTPVPSCPEWAISDLADHVNGVFRFVLAQLDAGPGADLQSPPPPPPNGGVLEQAHDTTDRLLSTLATTDPNEHRPNWAGAPTAAFWFRRMNQEMAIHGWDLANALGVAEPITRWVAVDGLDELFDVFAPHGSYTDVEGTSVHYHSTDGDGEWLLGTKDGRLDVQREHGKGDAAVRGTASDLLLLLWHRRSPEELEFFGDREVFDQWWAKSKI